jgi:carbon-monoxide dehydrogenase small subunit
MAAERAVTFRLDGETVTAVVEPRKLLVDYLTFDAHETGVHEGCCEGVCGACTIWVDGVPTRSCLAFVVEMEEHEVATPAHVLAEERFRGLHAALAAEHAIQCGYCIPGMLMSVIPDLAGEPEEQEPVERLLSGNVCRCAGYASIARALQAWRDASVEADKVAPGRAA